MAQVKLLLLANLVLSAMAVTVYTKTNQPELGQLSARDRSCELLRRRLLTSLDQAYSRSVQPFLLRLLMANWTDNFLSAICRHQFQVTPSLSQTPSQQRKKLFNPKPVIEVSFSGSEQKNKANSKTENVGAGLDVKEKIVPANSKKDQPAYDISWNNENTFAFNLQDEVKGHTSRARVKRFLNAGQPAAVPDLWSRILQRPTPSRARQLGNYMIIMNYLRQLSKFQRNKLIQQFLTTSTRQAPGLFNNVSSLSDNTYNNVYWRRKKREAVETRSLRQGKANLRKKRFLFGDLLETPPAPSLYSVMMGTAVDPNTGQRIEFGGDVMMNMIMDTFVQFQAPGAQPAPGKEHGELTKIMAPMWFFGNLQRAMNPPARYNTRSQSQRRNSQGYYGDTMYAGK